MNCCGAANYRLQRAGLSLSWRVCKKREGGRTHQDGETVNIEPQSASMHTRSPRPSAAGHPRVTPWGRVLSLVSLLAIAGLNSSCATMWNPFHTAMQAADHFIPTPPNPIDVLTQHNNPARTGADLVETQLRPEKLEGGEFQRLFDWKVDGQIYGQPLFVAGLQKDGRTLNVVLVTTTHNSVYAFEAPATGSIKMPNRDPLWQVNHKVLGAPQPFYLFGGPGGWLGFNIYPEVGIIATPVVDLSQGLVFVTAKSGSCALLFLFCTPRNRLFALDLATGALKGSTDIEDSYRKVSPGGPPFDAVHQLQRAGLALGADVPHSTGHHVYLTFASHQDAQPYHGFILDFWAVRGSQPVLKHVFCTTCGQPQDVTCKEDTCEGGIWQAGGAPVQDPDGNLYVMSGNGSTALMAQDLATSFIKLDPSLSVVGSWTPPNFHCLNMTDSDLGSAGPVLLSDQGVLIGGGKEGLLYALPVASLQGQILGPGQPLPLDVRNRDVCDYQDADGGQMGGPPWTIQAALHWDDSAFMDVLKLIGKSGLGLGYHHIHGAPVVWTVRDAHAGVRRLVYVSPERDVLRAFEFDQGFVHGAKHGEPPKADAQSRCPNALRGMPGGFLSLSANGPDPSSGILWAAMPRRDQDALARTVPGVLRAYWAYPDENGKLTEIWNSDDGPHPPSDTDCDYVMDSQGDELGNFAKDVPPTIADGKVYMATFSNRLVVYGLKPRLRPALLVAEGGTGEAFGATLSPAAPLPMRVEPGGRAKISITATNTGQQTWRITDGIRLDSQTIPDFDQSVVSGERALTLQHDVPPQGTYTFNFELRLPTEEGPARYVWRLKRADALAEQPGGDWFGQASVPWRFSVLRASCEDLRQRALSLTDQVTSEYEASRTSGSPAVSEQTAKAVRQLKSEAAQRHCSLRPNVMVMPNIG